LALSAWEAVLMALGGALLVIAGGPEVRKTTLVDILVKIRRGLRAKAGGLAAQPRAW